MLAGLHKTITISFLPVGHTKFSPDWCFGLLKQKFRKSEVNCLDDFVSVVHKSADVNAAQLVGTQSGEVTVPTHNWSGYLTEYLRKIPHITSQHTLQLCINSGLDLSQISRMTAVSRKLVGHFKHSVVAITGLRGKQIRLDIPQHHYFDSRCGYTLEFNILYARPSC